MVLPKGSKKAKRSSSSSSCLKNLSYFVLLLLVITIVFNTSYQSSEEEILPHYETTTAKLRANKPPLSPSTVEHYEEIFVDIEDDLDADEKVVEPLNPKGIKIGQTEVFYMLPSDLTYENGENPPEVVGILLFFHGCNHGGSDLFLLPEDRIVAHTALKRGLAILSPSSMDRTSGCWHHATDVPQFERDDVLNTWRKHVGLEDKKTGKKKTMKQTKTYPIIGMGASSGGAILKYMLEIVPFKSIAPYIMTLKWEKDDLERGHYLTKDGKKGNAIPPTAFVRMTLDDFRSKAINRMSEILVEAGNKKHIIFDIEPKPFTFRRCAKRLPELARDEENNKEQCLKIMEWMKRIPVIHSQTHMLKGDEVPDIIVGDLHIDDHDFIDIPQKNNEEDNEEEKEEGEEDEKMPEVAVPRLAHGGHTWLFAAFKEEIQTSYARHEMSAEHHEEVLTWLMGNAGLDVKMYETVEERIYENIKEEEMKAKEEEERIKEEEMKANEENGGDKKEEEKDDEKVGEAEENEDEENE